MTGLMESIVLAGVFAVVVFGAEPNLSEKSRNKGAFLSGLVAELSRNYSEKMLRAVSILRQVARRVSRAWDTTVRRPRHGISMRRN